MIRVRRSGERGHFNHGWLETYHTFSFARYYDPEQMGFRALRVINEDWIAGGRGFGTHPHEDMEIVTYVLEGGLAHRDSLGTEDVIRGGELQRMTAGTGIEHSEYNASKTERAHLYQIWLLPEREGLTPSYEQKAFPSDSRLNTLKLVASPDAAEGSLAIRQNTRIYLGALDAGHSFEHPLAPGRHAWVQVVRGNVSLNGETLREGDGAALSEESLVSLASDQSSEVLLFDLA